MDAGELAGPNALVDDAAALSRLIEGLYDAALRPEAWPAVMADLRDFVGGYSAAIYAKDIRGAAGGVYHDDGVLSAHYKMLYFEHYASLDPATPAHLFTGIDQPISTADFIDYEEFTQSRFFREWAAPQGIADFITAPIEKSGGWAAMFGVFRHVDQGLVDAPMRRRMRLVVPHVRRAVLIGRVIEQGDARAAKLGDTLDGLSAGLFLVDAQGRIVHANAAGTALLEAAVAVAQRRQRLVPLDRGAAASLAEVLAMAAMGDEAVGTRGISIPIEAADGEHFVAHVLPLTSGARRSTGASYHAVAAVFVQRATLTAPEAPEVLARTFGLTVSELRVLVAIVEAGGVAETARQLGIAETTVKTHLHRVFAKTGTSRQAELVKLLAGFASPLRGREADGK